MLKFRLDSNGFEVALLTENDSIVVQFSCVKTASLAKTATRAALATCVTNSGVDINIIALPVNPPRDVTNSAHPGTSSFCKAGESPLIFARSFDTII